MDNSEYSARQSGMAVRPPRNTASGSRHAAGDRILTRALKTTRHAWARARRPARFAVQAWTPHLTVLAIGAALLAVLVSAHDADILRFARTSGWQLFAFLSDITDVTLSQWFLVPALGIMLVIGLIDWSRRGWRRRSALAAAYAEAGFVFVTMAGTGILTNILKQIIGRARPRLIEEHGPLAFHPFQFEHAWQSFPSGHATTAGALAMALMLFHPRWRWPIAFIGAVLAFARVAAGAHYPSDIVAGFALGALCTLWAARWLAQRRVLFRYVSGKLMPALVRPG